MTRTHPQRVTAPAPVGSLLDRTASRSRAPKCDEGKEEEDYFDLIRQLPCLYCGVSPCEVAHVRMARGTFGKASGLQKKPQPRWTVPLCADDHRLGKQAQHNQGEERFWEAIDIDPLAVCQRLWERRGDFAAMEKVVVHAISERKMKKNI